MSAERVRVAQVVALSPGEVRWVKVCDKYDGPIHGIVMWRRRWWYATYASGDLTDDGDFREYHVRKLTSADKCWLRVREIAWKACRIEGAQSLKTWRWDLYWWLYPAQKCPNYRERSAVAAFREDYAIPEDEDHDVD